MPRKREEKAEVELLRGVRKKVRRDGTVVYAVSVSWKEERWQPEFADPGEANVYKRLTGRMAAEGLRPIGKDEWLASRSLAGPLPSSAAVDEDLPVAALVRRMAEALDEDSTNAGILVRYFESVGVADQPTSSLRKVAVVRLPAWLRDEGYDTSTAKAVLRLGERAFALAMGSRLATHNHFVALKARKPADYDRRGNRRIRDKAHAFTPEQLVSVASVLRPVYVLAYWLFALLGMRASEALGLRVSSWRNDDQYLIVNAQRRASLAMGLKDPKTAAGWRHIPVPGALARAIDAYILEHHGKRPDTPEAAKAWDERLLLVGAHGGAMDQASLRKALRRAYKDLGMTPERLGRFRPIHHLRKTIGAVLQKRKWKLSGAAIAAFLGHEHPERLVDDIAVVTGRHYNPLEFGEVDRLAERLNRWVDKKIMPLIPTGELLLPTWFEDAITLDEAAVRLDQPGWPCTVEDVQDLIQAQALTCVRWNFTGPLDRQVTLVPAADVDTLVAQRVRDLSDTYSATEVVELLALDRDVVYAMADAGEITEVTTNASARPRRRVGAGAVPGGGRRFDRASVDAICQAEVEDIMRRRTWLTTGEAATALKYSADVIRRMCDRGELECWRDPRTSHQRRMVSPDSVKTAQRDLEDITIRDAATLVGCPLAEVRSAIKLAHGRVRRGRTPGTFRKADLLAVLQAA